MHGFRCLTSRCFPIAQSLKRRAERAEEDGSTEEGAKRRLVSISVDLMNVTNTICEILDGKHMTIMSKEDKLKFLASFKVQLSGFNADLDTIEQELKGE